MGASFLNPMLENGKPAIEVTRVAIEPAPRQTDGNPRQTKREKLCGVTSPTFTNGQ